MALRFRLHAHRMPGPKFNLFFSVFVSLRLVHPKIMSSSTGKVALGAAHTFRRQWAQGPPPVLRNSNRRLDHVVLLERLPLSATPSDVARLQDALTPFGMSKRFPSEVVFLRTKLLKPSGRALFAFSRPAHADNFAKLANGKSLGGQQISAQRVSSAREEGGLE